MTGPVYAENAIIKEIPFLKLVTFSWKSQWEQKESLLGREGRPTMEEAGQDLLDDVQEVMEIPKLEVTKQYLDSLNSDLEKDLQRMDEANQVLLKKIQEKEETIQSLERDIMLSVRQAREREELNHLISEKEEALRDVELETAKLEKNKEILSRSVVEVQKEISKKFKNVGLDKEALKQMLAELKVKLQKSTESCASQEEELVKIESDYQSVYQLCEDQAHYIKKYQEILRQMEKEKEMLLLEKEAPCALFSVIVSCKGNRDSNFYHFFLVLSDLEPHVNSGFWGYSIKVVINIVVHVFCLLEIWLSAFIISLLPLFGRLSIFFLLVYRISLYFFHEVHCQI
ncbi:hypothetical protein FD754_022026 [Muntiacus muntjak]|uniref:Transmembrane and coiled-coil domain-containing protein 5B n=1 Tax=Muntiacus muntjak TaxID=9888 RepID=A0A5N3V9E3_MUNMU|nr:hypothetical protein FD754_022026 [Muntiacus muntjak]